MNNSKKNTNGEIIYYIISIMFTVISLSFLSLSTSPLFPECYEEINNNFSSMHQLIGKAYSLGKLPYRDLCGTEGPIFYFIQALGYTIAEREGVFILQLISISISICIILKTVSLKTSIRDNYWLCVCVFIATIAMIGTGNSSMEFALPVVTGFIYIVTDIMIKDDSSISGLKIFFLGILLGITIFLSLYAGFVLCVVLPVFFDVLRKKEMVLKKNVLLFFVGGVSLIVFPVVIYLAVNNAIPYFLQDYVWANIELLLVGSDGLNEIFRKIIKSMPALLIVFLLLIDKNLGNKDLKRLLIVLTSATSIILLLGMGYWHYYIMLIPCIILYVIYTEYSGEMVIKNIKKCLLLLIMVGVVMIPLKNLVEKSVIMYVDRDYVTNNTAAEQWMEDYIDNSNNTVIAVDLPASFYLSTDYIPNYRLFCKQSWLSSISEKYQKEIQNELNTNQYNYLLYGTPFFTEQIGDYYLIDNIYIYRSVMLYQLYK